MRALYAVLHRLTPDPNLQGIHAHFWGWVKVYRSMANIDQRMLALRMNCKLLSVLLEKLVGYKLTGVPRKGVKSIDTNTQCTPLSYIWKAIPILMANADLDKRHQTITMRDVARLANVSQ